MKYLHLKSIFFFTFLFSISISAQNSQSLWSKSTKQKASQGKQIIRKSQPKKAIYYDLDIIRLKAALQNAPKREVSHKPSNVIINFPTPEGKLEAFRVKEASVMHPILQKKYANMRSYIGQSIKNPSSIIRFSVTPLGLHTMTLSSKNGTQFIDPYNDNGTYLVYSKRDLPSLEIPFECKVIHDESLNKMSNFKSAFTRNADDGQMRTFSLALGTSVEYTDFHGGTIPLAMAAIMVSINRVSGIYERELSIKLELIANNDLLISTTGNSIFGNDADVIDTSTGIINGIVGETNYDIGHVFTTASGGVAGLGVVCTSSKGRGTTGLSSPVGDAFDIDFVAHEIGHQFGANHTFNGTQGECSGSNRESTTAYEPASGTTIMAYAGICGSDNIQQSSNDYFHQESLSEIWFFITSGSGTCANASAVSTGNTVPTAEAGASYTIPASTPYMLTGSSTETNGDPTSTHTFTWEQYDLGDAGLPMENDPSDGPLVRSFQGTSNPTRYIPRLADILTNGSISAEWEKLASDDRDINFKLTVRDNDSRGGQTATDDMKVTNVSAAGPFTVDSQDTPGIVWTQGNTETINWSVAGTTGNGINTANVDILLSIDGGLSYNLLETTPNDGSHVITVPNTPSQNCRIMVQGSGNIFFSINTEKFSIGNFVSSCTQYTSNSNLNLAIPDNTGASLTHTINIPDDKTISSIKVSTDITHTWVSDLTIKITHPNGTSSTTIWNRECDDEDGINVTFEDGAAINNCAANSPPPPFIVNGTFSPSSPLTPFVGLGSAGDWEIEITDNADSDSGNLNSWYIDVCESTLDTKTVNELSNLSLFPNPNKGDFTLSFDSTSGDNIKIDVYDISGRIVQSKVYGKTNKFNENIRLNGIQSGMYLLNVSDGLRRSTKKIIIE